MIEHIASARAVTQDAALAAGERSPAARRPRDLRTLRRRAVALSIVLGPLAVGVVRATVPLASSSDGHGAIAAFAAHLASARVELAAGVLATLFLPFAIVGLTRLVVRGAPVLAMLGGCLALVGWTMVPALMTGDAITYEMARSGANPAQLAALWDHLNASVTVTMLVTVFVVGHELGTLLLGVALARTRVVPLWAAAAVVIGIAMHPISVVMGSRLLDVLAYALVTAGCVAAARAVLCSPNDAWDLPPLSAR